MTAALDVTQNVLVHSEELDQVCKNDYKKIKNDWQIYNTAYTHSWNILRLIC